MLWASDTETDETLGQAEPGGEGDFELLAGAVVADGGGGADAGGGPFGSFQGIAPLHGVGEVGGGEGFIWRGGAISRCMKPHPAFA